MAPLPPRIYWGHLTASSVNPPMETGLSLAHGQASTKQRKNPLAWWKKIFAPQDSSRGLLNAVRLIGAEPKPVSLYQPPAAASLTDADWEKECHRINSMNAKLSSMGLIRVASNVQSALSHAQEARMLGLDGQANGYLRTIAEHTAYSSLLLEYLNGKKGLSRFTPVPASDYPHTASMCQEIGNVSSRMTPDVIAFYAIFTTQLRQEFFELTGIEMQCKINSEINSRPSLLIELGECGVTASFTTPFYITREHDCICVGYKKPQTDAGSQTDPDWLLSIPLGQLEPFALVSSPGEKRFVLPDVLREDVESVPPNYGQSGREVMRVRTWCAGRLATALGLTKQAHMCAQYLLQDKVRAHLEEKSRGNVFAEWMDEEEYKDAQGWHKLLPALDKSSELLGVNALATLRVLQERLSSGVLERFDIPPIEFAEALRYKPHMDIGDEHYGPSLVLLLPGMGALKISRDFSASFRWM